MQSTIYFMLAIVAFSAAKQLKPGPQTITESSSASKTNDKRYATQEFTLFLTPSEIKALNEARNSENKETETESQKENQQFILQSYSQPELNEWQKYAKLSSIEQPKEENQEQISQSQFLFKTKPVYENQEGNFEPFNFYQSQKSAEQQVQNIDQGSDKKEPEWIQYNPISKAEEESFLHEDLQQQWNRILEHNRGQLKSLSPAANEKQNSENSWANKDSAAQWGSNFDEETKSEIEKAIQYALKNQEIEFGQEKSRAEEQVNIQKSPLLIQREVKVTKHLPVPVIKKVKVSVPTPVLVPVPEPYEVKVPHPYPVPLHIIKHIPVPVVRKY